MLQIAELEQSNYMYIFVISQESQNCTYDILGQRVKIHVQYVGTYSETS